MIDIVKINSKDAEDYKKPRLLNKVSICSG
jgi:hypothetical protein